MNKYFEMDNEWGFADLGRFVGRKMIRGSMRVGANVEIQSILKDVAVHLSTDIKANLSYKGVQLMRTQSLHLLCGLHDVFQKEKVLEAAEKIISKHYDELTKDKDVVEPLSWSIDPGRAVGMPFKVLKEGERFEDNGRRG